MPTTKKPSTDRSAEAAATLEQIKKLLILQLLAAGVPSGAIASALGVHKSVVSRLVPARKLMQQLRKE
jgi:hypothetical protein